MYTSAGEPSMEQEFIRKLDEAIHKNLSDEHFGVEELAREMNLSRSALLRKLKMMTRKSVSQYIREVRLERAMEMLQKNMAPVSEIAYRTGFSSPAYFNTCFHEHYGFPPGEVKKKETLSHQPGPEVKEKEVQKLALSGINKRFCRWILPLSFFIVIILAIALFIFPGILKSGSLTESARIKNQEKSIAVLPFKNLSEDKENQYFADGVMEDILTNLSYIKDFKVISRTSVEEFRGSSLNLKEISKKLGVNYVLEGSVQRYGDKVRVRVQFIDARIDRHLLSETFDRDMTDIFIIQSDIARKVANELQATLSPEEVKLIEKISTHNMEAYELYLRGRFFWNKRNKVNQLKSVEFFEKALAVDPGYALAYAGLADAYYILTWWQWYPRPEGYEKAKKLALKALELDNNVAEAHATLGGILSFGEWKWEEARKELLLATEINPNYATGHQYLAEFLDITGDREGARASIDKACELDPYSYGENVINALCYFNEGKFSEALDYYRKTLEFDPGINSIYLHIFQIFLLQHDEIKANEAFINYLARDTLGMKRVNEAEEIYSREGLKGLMKMYIDLEYKKSKPDPYTLASRYALLGEKSEVLNWLEKAVEERIPSVPRINSALIFKNFRSEPRFRALIDKMGLAPYSM